MSGVDVILLYVKLCIVLIPKTLPIVHYPMILFVPFVNSMSILVTVKTIVPAFTRFNERSLLRNIIQIPTIISHLLLFLRFVIVQNIIFNITSTSFRF